MTNYERPVAYNRKARKFCVTLALLGYRNCKDDLWKFLAACAQQASFITSVIKHSSHETFLEIRVE